MRKFKGYDVVDHYPEDGWLRGYFYVNSVDIKDDDGKITGAYQDLSYLKHKDCVLNLLCPKRGERILDIGCADGTMMVYCGLLGAEVYGVDLSSKHIEKANSYLKKYKLKGRAVAGDARRLDFEENYFDKAVSTDFFEHLSLEDNILALKEIKRVLKPGGVIVIKTPNLTYLRSSRLYKMINRAIRLKNPFNVVIAHTCGNNPQHIGLATKKKMVKVIRSAGFLNFKFYPNINSKIERFSYSLGELFSEMPLLRDLFTEDLTVVIYKPIILSLLK